MINPKQNLLSQFEVGLPKNHDTLTGLTVVLSFVSANTHTDKYRHADCNNLLASSGRG
jgi:hypothetical protein